jgi:23S rRNA pseudouridine1911/1915/1917 synthase
MKVIYEDNHIIVVNKSPGEIVQGDKTGDVPLADLVRQYIKEKYQKPGNVFLGVVHRLDRPVGGLVIFARTSKALSRLNRMFANGEIHKTYWAITPLNPQLSARHNGTFAETVEARTLNSQLTLTHWLTRNEQQNKSYAYDHEVPGSKKAQLRLSCLATGDRYQLLEVQLLTGRHHQIRCQLAAIGCPIKGDLKYGAPRSNPDGSISLLARSISFVHPVSGEALSLQAPIPDDSLWKALQRV